MTRDSFAQEKTSVVAVYVDVDLTTGVPPSYTDGEKLAGMIALRLSTYSPNTRDQQPRTKEAATMSETNERSVASDGSLAKPSGVAAACAAAADIGLAMRTVEGFPTRSIGWDAKGRFFVVEESISNHCCFGYTVCDRTKPVLIHGVHYKERYETVCECFELEEAALVCMALNSYAPPTDAK
jgi:hypothetical protein